MCVHKTLCKLSQYSLAAGHGLVGLSYDGLSVTGALVISDHQWTYAHHRALLCSTFPGHLEVHDEERSE